MPPYPRFFRVRQTFERPQVRDIAAEVERQLAALKLSARVGAGQSVAVTVGSRGIANIHRITKGVVDHLKGLGAKPFLVPAMGSHGGATAEGQRAVLEHYGVTEEFCGCPIRSSMETVVVCQAAQGFPIHFDRHAYEADHVVVCGRIKPHTSFTGTIESGLMKMLLIGLGKHAGAKVYHQAIFDYSFDEIVRSVAAEVIQKCRVVAGLGIVENAYDETALLAGVLPEQIEPREKELLALAKAWMPRLPFGRADVLLIDRMGKNISGTGIDTNVVGRKHNDNAAVEGETPRVRRIVARSLTPESAGNAIGVGIADFCTRRLADAIDAHSTRTNALTSGHLGAAKLPLVYATDREILDAALPTIGLTAPRDARVLWIRDTLDLAEVECSAAYLEEAERREDLEVLTEPRALTFDVTGNLPDDQRECGRTG